MEVEEVIGKERIDEEEPAVIGEVAVGVEQVGL